MPRGNSHCWRSWPTAGPSAPIVLRTRDYVTLSVIKYHGFREIEYELLCFCSLSTKPTQNALLFTSLHGRSSPSPCTISQSTIGSPISHQSILHSTPHPVISPVTVALQKLGNSPGVPLKFSAQNVMRPPFLGQRWSHSFAPPAPGPAHRERTPFFTNATVAWITPSSPEALGFVRTPSSGVHIVGRSGDLTSSGLASQNGWDFRADEFGGLLPCIHSKTAFAIGRNDHR